MVDRDRRRISSRPTHRSARLRSLVDQGLKEAGIESTGACRVLMYFVFVSKHDTAREKLYAFFMALKQPDGSFLVAHDAEIDVR